MPHAIWLLLLMVILIVAAQYITEGPFRMIMYVLAVVVAIVAVVQLTGLG